MSDKNNINDDFVEIIDEDATVDETDESLQKEEERKNASEARKSLIGTGDRSEKIRTYNFPQDRITDHRIHYSRSNIPAAMDGEIDDLIAELTKYERQL